MTMRIYSTLKQNIYDDRMNPIGKYKIIVHCYQGGE